ncbi:phage tail protein [Streptococcus infantis]|nr:phage tail protein [Streptococcus infantis]MBZ2109884.1 phage tail protein [Streptococcus infantis]MBZ2111732.1 phage tail protein [Streptococcus infantis]
MLTFYNEKGEAFGAQVEFTVKNAVNGERSVSGTIISNDRVLSEIDRGWKFELNGEFYNIVYAKPRDEGRNLSVSFDAVHQFFYDFGHSNCYTEFNGSHRFEVYIEAIFKDSGYRYQIGPRVRVNSIRKENFGNSKRLEMFKDIIKAAGLEFSVSGKVVLITKKIGADLSTVVRKNFNMNELVIEKNINKFITYKRGLGAWKDEEDHSKGRYTSEYESPLASIYGRIEGEPVTDERYKNTGELLRRLKFEVDNSYSISVQLDMEDLTRAGYQYTQPRAGDYIMAINETIGFWEKIRIVSFESSYDVTGRLINHKVTCNDIGSVQKQISSEGSIIRSVGQSKEYAESALAVATKALASADGKNTVYYGATKPKDEPIGTIRRGDILYLTAGEDTEMYTWNGAEWELRKLKLDTAEFEKKFDEVKKAVEQASEENKRRSDEAFKKAGTSEDLAKEAKRIGLDSVSKLDEFKRQATNAQTALSGDLGVLKRTIANDIRPKQEQVTAEIEKQVKALIQTKNELAGVKSAQATYEEMTTRRLAELTNLANGKASKSELTQTAEELASKIASVRVGGVNLFKGSKDFSGSWVNLGNWTRESEKYQGMTVMSRVGTWFGISQAFETQKGEVYTLSFYIKSSIDRDRINVYFTHASTNQRARTSPYMSSVAISNEWQRTSVTFEITESGFILPRIERFNTEAPVYVAGLKLERGNISTDYSEAPEDIEGQISIVESSFRQRADALDAGVSRLTEGLRTKADISSLNVTAENIRQSVKSLETDTQNKLNQMLSLAEFEVRASSIRQEILNATKDKADKTLVVAEAGKLRTELSTVQDYVNKDGQRKEELQRYTREESARQVNAVREQISREYVGKSTHQEDVRGIERRFEAITNPQNGTIATQIANYKQSVDGRLAGIISQIAGKANQTDFQRVQETSRLYERILGNTNNSIADNVARMAMTSQLFQVEVGKYSVSGPNLIKNSDFKNGTKEWASTRNLGRLVKHDFYHNSQKDLMRLSNSTQRENHLDSHRFELERNTDYMLNFRGFNNSRLLSYDVFILGRRAGESNGFTIIKQIVSGKKLSTARCEDISVTFNSGEMDNAFIRFDNNGSSSGTADLYITEIDLYKGYKPRAWQPHPEDAVADANAKLEATQTKMTQLAGSWAVQNLTSAGALVSGLNLGANGHNRLDGKLTHITGETLIDNAVIKDGMIASLSASKITAGTIDASKINVINVNASSILAGTLTGMKIRGGQIDSINGNMRINLQTNQFIFNGRAGIEFKSPGNSLEFNSGGRKAFLAPTVSEGTNYAAFAFGVNDRGSHNPNRDFVGLKIFNEPDARQVVIVGDLILTSYANQGIQTTSLKKMFELINDNFKRLREFRVQNGEGSPGFWDVTL